MFVVLSASCFVLSASYFELSASFLSGFLAPATILVAQCVTCVLFLLLCLFFRLPPPSNYLAKLLRILHLLLGFRAWQQTSAFRVKGWGSGF